MDAAAEQLASAGQERLILERGPLPRARRAPGRARAGSRRHLPGRDRREAEDARALRRHHRARVRRPRAPGGDLRADRRAHVGGVDVGAGIFQFASHHGGGGAALRHRGAEAPLPAAFRERRAARRHRADRARLRHRPAGDPHPRAPRGRSLRRQRREDLDHQQRRRADSGGAGEDRSSRRAGAQGHEPAADRERAGLQGRAQARQARLPRHRHRRAAVRGLPRAGREPDRARRRGAACSRC